MGLFTRKPVEHQFDFEAVESRNRGIADIKAGRTSPVVRTFSTGANRDVDTNKPDYEGFISPLVWRRFAKYMNKNRLLKDGSVRASDNWQKGIPQDVYAKSFLRHAMDFWLLERGWEGEATQDIEEALCGILFNVQGYLHERLKADATAFLTAPQPLADWRQEFPPVEAPQDADQDTSQAVSMEPTVLDHPEGYVHVARPAAGPTAGSADPEPPALAEAPEDRAPESPAWPEQHLESLVVELPAPATVLLVDPPYDESPGMCWCDSYPTRPHDPHVAMLDFDDPEQRLRQYAVKQDGLLEPLEFVR